MTTQAHATRVWHGDVDDGDEAVAQLQPGEVLHYDYRSTSTTTAHKRKDAALLQQRRCSGTTPRALRVLQWNIERGTQIEGLVQTMRACAADVYILQELDIGCRRSGYANVPQLLAQALEAQVYFVCEFDEQDSATRPPESCVGPQSPPFRVGPNSRSPARADTPLPPRPPSRSHTRRNDDSSATTPALRHLHGNAILSCGATMHDPVVLTHRDGADWAVMGARLREPRRGARAALRVTLYTDNSDDDGGNRNDRRTATTRSSQPLYVYCCHLEPFCGTLTRVRQLGDCMHDAQQLLQYATQTQRDALRAARQQQSTQQQPPRTTTTTTTTRRDDAKDDDADDVDASLVLPAFIIAGDFNTMGHGLVRLSRLCCSDRMRVLSLGESEACWLQRKVLARGMAARVAVRCCPFSLRFLRMALSRLYAAVADRAVVWRCVYGFRADALARLDNTALCLYDPGDKATSITLDHPAYRGWVRGKLDWVLLSNVLVQPLQRDGDGMPAIDVAYLVDSGSVTSPASVAALRRTTAADEAAHAPDDGYVLINEHYRDSDHRGLLLTVRPHRGVPLEAYPVHGAVYTSSWSARATWALTRALPPVLLLSTAAAWLHRRRDGHGGSIGK